MSYREGLTILTTESRPRTLAVQRRQAAEKAASCWRTLRPFRGNRRENQARSGQACNETNFLRTLWVSGGMVAGAPPPNLLGGNSILPTSYIDYTDAVPMETNACSSAEAGNSDPLEAA